MSIAQITPSNIDTASIVAANIRAEAARRGYSQSELGRALGITQSQINRRWRGVIPWQLAELDTVSYLLGVSVIELVTPPRGGLGYEKSPSAKAPGLSDLVAGTGFEPATSGL